MSLLLDIQEITKSWLHAATVRLDRLGYLKIATDWALGL